MTAKQIPCISAPIEDDLVHLTRIPIEQLREAESAKDHLDELVSLIMKLTDSGMTYFFIEPLERVKAGMITTKAAQLGLMSTQKGMKMVIQNVLGRLDDAQLLMLADFIEEILPKAGRRK